MGNDAIFRMDPNSPLTTWGQVQQDLERRLDRREFSPGLRLPPETALAAHYGVSRVTIRRALQFLIDSGRLHSRRGSGTYVSNRMETRRFDVNLLRPWREQLLAAGHIARPRLVNPLEPRRLPPELATLVDHDGIEEFFFGLHIQEVDDVAIAANESWFPAAGQGLAMRGKPSSLVSAACLIETRSADARRAELLAVLPGAQLLEVTACSRLRETGQVVEIARTSWVSSRVNLTYHRALTAGQIDMSEILTFSRDAESEEPTAGRAPVAETARFPSTRSGSLKCIDTDHSVRKTRQDPDETASEVRSAGQ